MDPRKRCTCIRARKLSARVKFSQVLCFDIRSPGTLFCSSLSFLCFFFFSFFCFFLATIKPYNCQPLVRAVLRRFNRYHQVYQRTILINLRHGRNCSLVICNICKASKIYFLLFNVFHVCPTYVSF